MTLFEHDFVAAGSIERPVGDTGRMLQMMTGYWVTQVVRTAAELRIADHLHAHGATPAEVAEAESLDPEATFRFLRACASLGLAVSTDGKRFAGTPLLDTLRTDAPGSLRDLALWGGAESHWLPWGRLADAVRTGTTQAEAALGAPIFDWLAAAPKEAEVFTNAMTAMTHGLAHRLADVIDLKGTEVVADVGGAGGNLVQTLMQRHPRLTGVVLDLPHVGAEADTSAATLGVTDRFTFVGGDFFEEVPSADVHLLKFVLHDWDDDSCVRILRNCREALRPGGRVLVMELLVDEVGTPGLEPLMDLNMMALSTGRERSLDEFENLFERAGLKPASTKPSATRISVLELVPA
ncbi:methyltransferase [Streptomyces prasinopilosus]|uniref:Ubiquinone/menaquinone biosynthesis C-methylase UbiE n=1 Tax=Streptomyces prasinopilosus TaxID=67344 RepID=A0A1G6TMP6_9ACTN|nr:methyltransferase [Streptomyces prasinopilosus]SDD30363.1 Ubiquinone/menaquinone biosynthesis C-methylase UbiE [Streptomyces prasinopilosus]